MTVNNDKILMTVCAMSPLVILSVALFDAGPWPVVIACLVFAFVCSYCAPQLSLVSYRDGMNTSRDIYRGALAETFTHRPDWRRIGHTSVADIFGLTATVTPSAEGWRVALRSRGGTVNTVCEADTEDDARVLAVIVAIRCGEAAVTVLDRGVGGEAYEC